MTDPHVADRLSEFVDGGLDDAARASVAAHLEVCAGCRGLARDLERLRAAARGLGPIAPPDHVWLEVAGRIHLDSAPPTAVPAPRPSRRPAFSQYLGLAAALVVIASGVYLLTDRTPAPGPPSAADVALSVSEAGDELAQALAHYERAITALESAADTGDSTLDPAVAATLKQNLSIVDQAIADSYAALKTDPESEPARTTLMDALRQKVAVLQTTVALMNEMSKGDQDGAARVLSNSGRKG